jgi:hypothetical protein
MGYASQEGQIGLKTQTVEGTYKDPGATSPNQGVFMRHLKGSLGANRELIIPDPEIGGNRDIPQSLLGPASYSGDLDFYCRFESLATILYAACGSKSSTTTGTTPGTDLIGTHVITPVDSALTLPFLSMEEDIAGGLDTFRYTDVRVDGVSLSAEPAGYLMGTMSALARTQLAGVTKTAAPVTDLTPLTVGTSMSISIDGITTYIVRNFSMDFKNNVESDVFGLGSIALQDLTPKRRELTVKFTIRPTGASAKNLWRQATYGATAATGPQSGAAYQAPVIVHIDSFEKIATGPATKYSLDINIPAAIIKPFKLEPSNDDVIEYDVEIQAIRPSNASPLVTFTIVNGKAAVV